MALGGCHFVDELAVICKYEHASCILVKPPYCLYALHCAFLRVGATVLAARYRRWAMLTVFVSTRCPLACATQCRRGCIVPKLALHGVVHAVIRSYFMAGIANGLAVKLHQALLHQPSANAAGAKALAVE